MKWWYFNLFIILGSDLIGQSKIEIDTNFLNTDKAFTFLNTKSLSDPNKAALLSALLPGLGQVYNRQYWKVPIIYSSAIVMGHYIRYNHEIYNAFRTGLIAESDNRPETVNRFNQVIPNRYDRSAIQRRVEYFRRNRDYLIIWSGVLYMINIAEAHIAAHLKEFDVNDGISIRLQPSIEPTPLFSQAKGISLVISF